MSVINLLLTNIDDAFLPHRWPKHTPATAVQLRHDDVLGLVGRGPGGEVDADGSVALLRKRHQEVVVDHRLSGSCGSHDQYGHLMWQISPEEEELAWCFCRGYDKIRHLRERQRHQRRYKDSNFTLWFCVMWTFSSMCLLMYLELTFRFIFKVFFIFNLISVNKHVAVLYF